MSTPYRLSVAPSLREYAPELEFACTFLDRCHEVERSAGAETILHYGDDPPPGAVRVPPVLFPRGVRLEADGLHPDFPALAEIETDADDGKGLLPRRPGRTVNELAYDALGLVFLLLSRLEERGNPAVARDRYGRFPSDASLQSRRARLDEPLADIAVRDLAIALTGEPCPRPRTRYRVRLTHDVDRLRGYQSFGKLLKMSAGDIVFRRDPGSAAARLWRASASGEPWRACRRIMDASEARGLTSRFYFMGPTDDPMDSPYLLRAPGIVRDLASEIRGRGHVVGFHPGVRTRRDAEEWRRQKAGLEAVVDCGITEGRQHALLFDADATWDIWDGGGMEADMTLGYPEPSGFRSGTCRSHPTYSLRRRRTLSLVAFPTAIMDFGFFGGRYRDLTVDEAIVESQRIIDVCREFGGDLVVLFHPADMRPPRTTYFDRLLDIL